MISAYEVGAIFRIVDDATLPLKEMLKQVRLLNKAIKDARIQMEALGKPVSTSGAIAEADRLAASWAKVTDAAAEARLAIAGASKASPRRLIAPAAGAAGGGGGGGGRGRTPSWPGRRSAGSGAHISGPGVPIGGGGHIRFRGNMGGAAMAGAGLAAYGAYEAAELEDTVWQLAYHSGQEYNEANKSRFRNIVQEAMRSTGFGLHDISEAAKQEIRMFQGTPGGGLDVLPEMLRASAIEARVKGESPEESMKALIGLAHMTKAYDPAAIKKLAPAFAFLSTANPGSLGSIEKAAGYAVPLLQSGLEIDPVQTLLLGTALTRAGATSTKSGTWLREMAIRAMPGTSLMSKMAFKKHEEALKAFGLVDDKHHPTWFTDGKPDLMKMLETAGQHAAKIPVEKRASYERGLFGAQGGGGFALLADPAVREQITALRGQMNSPDFKNRYSAFLENYGNQVTSQNARTAMQEFNTTMADLGVHVLPVVNRVLGNFKSILEGIRGVLPGASTKEKSDALTTIGTRVMEGAGLGALAGGLVGFGGGAVPGAAIGGAAGAVAGGVEVAGKMPWYLGAGPAGMLPLNDAAKKESKIVVTPPVNLSINLDGHLLAQVMSNIASTMNGVPVQAPAADGLEQSFGGDHNQTDK